MRTTALDAATLEKLISAAVAAPSIHNTQPWRYRLDPGTSTVEVRAAPERGLRQIDPVGRALHISVGAAVFNLRVAVAHFGWEPVVRLLPQPADPGFLAAVRLAGPLPGSPGHGADLFDALWRRHSSRFPFSGRRVPPEILAGITEAVRAEGARLTLPGPAETTRILELTADAERRSSTDPDRRKETRAWVRDGAPDGLPGSVLGPQDATGRLPVRDFTALSRKGRQPSAVFEQNPVIAVLSTAHDTRADWLRAGQALESALLVATSHRVRTSMLHQAVEWPDLRWALRDVRDRPQYVQMLIRLGYGPEGPATPRRAVGEVLGG
jgi:hypothetical protein